MTSKARVLMRAQPQVLRGRVRSPEAERIVVCAPMPGIGQANVAPSGIATLGLGSDMYVSPQGLAAGGEMVGTISSRG